MRSYTLDAEQAKQAESFGKYISESGKYIGTITSAKAILSQQKTEGIELSFKTNDGKEANYIQLWTYNMGGTELYGLKVLNALMTVLRCRELKPSQSVINGEQVTIFNALMNKPLGALLQREEYTKNNNEQGYKMILIAPFDAQSEMTASEILNKSTKAESLVGMVSYIKANPVKTQKNIRAKSTAQSSDDAPPIDTNFDDDLTF